MLTNVFHIFAKPNIPPPTIEPIAIVRTVLLKAIICSDAEPPAAYS